MSKADARQHGTFHAQGIPDQEDVGRLQVEMKQIGAMQGLEGLENLAPELLNDPGLDPPCRLDAPSHRLPFEQGLHDKEIPVGVHARVERRHEIRMAQRLGAQRIIQQALALRAPGVDVGIEDLERDGPALDRVLATIDGPHGALPELRVNAITLRERLADETDFKVLGNQPGSVEGAELGAFSSRDWHRVQALTVVFRGLRSDSDPWICRAEAAGP